MKDFGLNCGTRRQCQTRISCPYINNLGKEVVWTINFDNNLGIRLSSLGRREEALVATQDAVDLFLAKTRPEAFSPDLAMSLNNLGGVLSSLGRREEALVATQDAVDIRRELAKTRPEAFSPDLATSLNNLGADLSSLGRREEALVATQDAVDLFRELAKTRPEAFSPDLATSLGALGSIYKRYGEPKLALDAFSSGVRVLWPYFEKSPQAHGRLFDKLLTALIQVKNEANLELAPDLRDLVKDISVRWSSSTTSDRPGNGRYPVS